MPSVEELITAINLLVFSFLFWLLVHEAARSSQMKAENELEITDVLL